MMRNPEGQEDTFGDGVQPENLQRLGAEGTEGDWSAVQDHFEKIIDNEGGPWSTIHGEPPEKI